MISRHQFTIDGERYVSLAEARRITRRTPYWLARQVMWGTVRTVIRPGCPPAYRYDDVMALASQGREETALSVA